MAEVVVEVVRLGRVLGTRERAGTSLAKMRNIPRALSVKNTQALRGTFTGSRG